MATIIKALLGTVCLEIADIMITCSLQQRIEIMISKLQKYCLTFINSYMEMDRGRSERV